LFSATAVAGLADGCRIAALAVLAVTLTDSPILIALVTVAARAPSVIIGPFSGAVADAVDPWRTMWWCLAARAGVVAGFALLVLTGNAGIWLLIAVSFVIRSVDTLTENLTQAVVPQVAGKRGLEAANSWILGAQSVTVDFIGTPFGPLLLTVAAALPFGTDAVLSAVAAVLIWSHRRRGPATRGARLRLRGIGSGAAEGIRWLLRDRTLRTVAAIGCLINCATVAVLSVAVLYTVQVLHVDASVYGVLLLVVGLGGLGGLAATARCVARLGRANTLLLAAAMCPPAFALGGLTSDPFIAAGALSLVGFAASVMTVVTVSLRQDTIAAARFGRVNAAYRMINNGFAPLAGLAGGVLASVVGLRAPFFLSVALTALATVLVLRLKHAVPGGFEHPGGGVQVTHDEVVGVEGGDDEDALPGRGQRGEHGVRDAGHVQVELRVDAEAEPPSVGLGSSGQHGHRDDQRQFPGGAGQ
jgi:MFS family permease